MYRDLRESIKIQLPIDRNTHTQIRMNVGCLSWAVSRGDSRSTCSPSSMPTAPAVVRPMHSLQVEAMTPFFACASCCIMFQAHVQAAFMCVFAKGASCIDAQTDCTRRQLSFFCKGCLTSRFQCRCAD